jgi:four helix bundle protein
LGCGTSVGANIEEALAGQSSADFLGKCSIALKEARETIYWLMLTRASGESANDMDGLPKEANEISRIIGSIIVSMRNGKKHR